MFINEDGLERDDDKLATGSNETWGHHGLGLNDLIFAGIFGLVIIFG